MIASREQEEVNFKPRVNTNTNMKNISNNTNIKEDKLAAEIQKNNNINKNNIQNQPGVKNISAFAKTEFEKVFNLNSEKEKVDLIENYKISKIEKWINSKVEFPENSLIVIINTKKTLLNLVGQGQKGLKSSHMEYDFYSSLFMRMWNIIVELSKQLSCENGKMKIFERIKIFTLNKHLEYLYDLTQPLSRDNMEKYFMPVINKCVKVSQENSECDIYNCLKQLYEAMENNKSIFPENFAKKEERKSIGNNIASDKNNPYTLNSLVPDKNKFHRIILFNGTNTELINKDKFEDLLFDFKSKYNIVFNIFLYEYDFQYEKKIHELFLIHNLLDFKISDFEIFMERDNNEGKRSDYVNFINNFNGKIARIENNLHDFFSKFLQIKNLIFDSGQFKKHGDTYDSQRERLMQDYNIVKINHEKYREFTKANINKQQADYIRKSFYEMLNQGVINNLVSNVKSSINMQLFNKILEEISKDMRIELDSLAAEISKYYEDSIKNLSKK